MKIVKEKTDFDFLELVCQLHNRSFMQPENKKLLKRSIETRQELENRILTYQNFTKTYINEEKHFLTGTELRNILSERFNWEKIANELFEKVKNLYLFEIDNNIKSDKIPHFYEKDNTTAMNCKYCGKSKWRHNLH